MIIQCYKDVKLH